MDNIYQSSDENYEVHQYLDKALSPEAQNEFEQRLSSDPALSSQVQQEQQFRDHIKTYIHRPQTPETFIQDIQNKLR